LPKDKALLLFFAWYFKRRLNGFINYTHFVSI
jgi:hypothetical protein